MTRGTSGPTSPKLLAYFDRDESCWKTCQGIFPSDSEPYSATWPQSGMACDGFVYQLQAWAPRTDANGSTSLLPTPDAASGGQTVPEGSTWRGGLAYRPDGTKIQVGLQAAAIHLMPTPTARDWKSGQASAATHARNSRPLNLFCYSHATPVRDMDDEVARKEAARAHFQGSH